MIKYLKLMRVLVWPASLFSFVVGFGVGATEWTGFGKAVFGFLAMFSFLGFVYALNFYSDRDVDRYHDGWQKDIQPSKQPLLTGEVTEKECIVFCILTFLAMILFSALVSKLFALLMFSACVMGGVLYSHPRIRLKAEPLADILCMGFSSALLFSAGYALAQAIMPTWLMILFFGLFSITVYIPTVVSDYEFDLKARVRTSAVVFGQRNLMKGMVISCLLSLLVAYWIIVEGFYPLGTKALAILACATSIIITSVAWKSLKLPRMIIPIFGSYPRQSIISFGIISLLFVGYGFFKVLFGYEFSIALFGVRLSFEILRDPFQIPWNIFG